MKILVVEDDVLIAQALKMTLGDLKYTVEVAHDGQAGLDFIEAFDYDLLLLDALLPKLDGISLCRYVRSRGYMMPILLLTSKDSKHDRAIGLDAGADDYVVKPFDLEELSARIRALLRRGNDRVQPVLTWEQLTLDPRNYEVTYQDRLLNLTPKEYALLELFLRYNRRLFSCGAILQHLWTYEDAPSEEAVRTHIKGLRHKLKAAGAPVDFIETVYGIGYRLKGDASTDVTPERVHPRWRSHSSGESNENELDDSHSQRQCQPEIVTPEPTPNSQQPPATDSLQFLTEIWNRHHAQTLERVDAIDLVITAISDGSLTPEISSQARNSAHTLAGTLGTFGLTLGSQVAKQIELLLTENPDLTPAQVSQLQHNIAQLRQEIASNSPRTNPVKMPTQPPQLSWLLAISTEPDLASALRSAASNFEIVTTTELTPSQLDRSPSAIILDLDCFPRIADGLNALSELERDYPQLPVLVLSQPDSQLSNFSPQDTLISRHRQSLAVISPPPSIDSIWMGTEPLANIAIRGAQQLHQRIEVARRGVRLFLSKPIPARQILAAVDRVLAQALATQARVTIVDDDLLLLEGVKALLSVRGMTVTTLSEPRRFWETLEASEPDLLILDLDMPTYDGIELCRAVRTDPQWATLPILFLTAHTASLAIDRVFAAGADDFVTKPASDSTLVTRIVNRLERIGFLGVRSRE
jgi:DNA-binding response OmpR family regulator